MNDEYNCPSCGAPATELHRCFGPPEALLDAMVREIESRDKAGDNAAKLAERLYDLIVSS